MLVAHGCFRAHKNEDELLGIRGSLTRSGTCVKPAALGRPRVACRTPTFQDVASDVLRIAATGRGGRNPTKSRAPYRCDSSEPDTVAHRVVLSTTETVATTWPSVRVRDWMGRPGRSLANQKTASLVPSRTV